jgi:hypothetical protein
VHQIERCRISWFDPVTQAELTRHARKRGVAVLYSSNMRICGSRRAIPLPCRARPVRLGVVVIASTAARPEVNLSVAFLVQPLIVVALIPRGISTGAATSWGDRLILDQTSIVMRARTRDLPAALF